MWRVIDRLEVDAAYSSPLVASGKWEVATQDSLLRPSFAHAYDDTFVSPPRQFNWPSPASSLPRVSPSRCLAPSITCNTPVTRLGELAFPEASQEPALEFWAVVVRRMTTRGQDKPAPAISSHRTATSAIIDRCCYQHLMELFQGVRPQHPWPHLGWLLPTSTSPGNCQCRPTQLPER